MSYRVLIVPKARAQINEADEWWREHSADPERLERALGAAITILMNHPDTGIVFPRARQPGVRCYLIRQTQHLVFYRVDHQRLEVRILALWHTSRGSSPAL